MTNFENTVKSVETFSTRLDTLESVVPSRNELKQVVADSESKINAVLSVESDKIRQLVSSNTHDIGANRSAITEIVEIVKTIEDFGVSTAVGTPTISKVAALAYANQFVSGNKMYWRAINFGKRSGIFMMIVKNDNLYKELQPAADAPADAKKTYELNFNRIQKVLNLKITNVKEFNMRMSLSGNLVAKCRVMSNGPSDSFTKIKNLIDRKHEVGISKYVHIQLITPEEFDISDILDYWIDNVKCAIKYDVTKSGGVTVMVNDGVTFDASGSIPAVTADKKDNVYLQSCSRINILNPHETAKLENPTISNLRKLASGKWFVANGQMLEYPESFKRVPRNPGFVNETYDKDFSGEFDAEDAAEDSDSWSASDSEVEEVNT